MLTDRRRLGALPLEGSGGFDRVIQYQRRQLGKEAELAHGGQELIGAEQTVLGMCPADQRLGRDRLVGRQVDDGLVAEGQLPVDEGGAQLVEEG